MELLLETLNGENEPSERGNDAYVFAEKLKFVFQKVLAIFDLGDPLVQIHVSLPLRLQNAKIQTRRVVKARPGKAGQGILLLVGCHQSTIINTPLPSLI